MGQVIRHGKSPIDLSEWMQEIVALSKDIKSKQNPEMIDWDTCFMNMAVALTEKSKDPSSQVACIIVDKNKHPISFGLNGWVAGCNEMYMTYERREDYQMKYLNVCHAEMNALLLANRGIPEGCTIYTTHAPCNDCLKYLCQKRPDRIWYKNNEPTVKRGTMNQKEALLRMLWSMKHSTIDLCRNMTVRNIDTKVDYDVEIWESESKETWQRQMELAKSVHEGRDYTTGQQEKV